MKKRTGSKTRRLSLDKLKVTVLKKPNSITGGAPDENMKSVFISCNPKK